MLSQLDFVVFLSYDRDDKFMKISVENTLNSLPGVRLWTDSRIGFGENIRAKIDAGLKESDCMLVILTENSIASFEVWEEMIRANERQIPIYAIKEDGVSKDRLPHFIAESVFIRYSKNNERAIDEVLKELRDKIVEVKERTVNAQILSSTRELREISRLLLDNSKTELFRAEIVGNVIDRTKEEVRGILGERYNIDIGLESAFLIRATPLFQNAEKIYAVSYDKISTFWKNPTLREVAKDYLRNHTPQVIRLFVFSTPLEAHKYIRILHAHAEHYNREGAVLLCSADNYVKIVERVTNQKDQVSVLLTEDFGVLDFGNKLVEARLSETKLEFSSIKESVGTQINHRKFMELLERFSRLPPGTSDGQYGVLRWHPDYLNSIQGKWVEALNQLFPSPLRDAFHLVFFTKKNGDGREARNKIAEIKDKLANLDVEVRPKEIWFGKFTKVKAKDSKYGGPLKTGDEFPYALLMRLESLKQLEDYQNKLEHSDIRNYLYGRFDERIQNLYHFMEPLEEDDPRREKLFDVVEDLSTQYMVRMDYMDDTEISSIVLQPWYPF